MKRCCVMGLLLLGCWTKLVCASEPARPAMGLAQTSVCRSALAALAAHENELIRQGTRAGPSARAQLKAEQTHAARACLGEGGTSGTRQREPRAPQPAAPPISGPSARPRSQQPAPVPPAPAAGPPVGTPPQPPLTLGVCDATGCWASDGTRLQRLGTLLVGPRGVCTRPGPGPLVNCP